MDPLERLGDFVLQNEKRLLEQFLLDELDARAFFAFMGKRELQMRGIKTKVKLTAEYKLAIQECLRSFHRWKCGESGERGESAPLKPLSFEMTKE